MRRPRRLPPRTRWSITVRCARAQFRLRPDPQRVHAVGFFLGRALEACGGIQLHAVVQMSNHLHLELTDTASELDRFMCRFLGPLARSLNQMDDVRGQVFERRYAAIEVVDDEALLSRIAYAVTNPAAADLVDQIEDWPGLCLWPGGPEVGTYERFRKPAYDRALQAAGGDRAAVAVEDFTDVVDVAVSAPRLEGRDARAELRSAVRARLAELREARGRKRVLGVLRVLAQRVFDAPERPKRRPMPLCHASTADLWLRFRDGWRNFVRDFRAASAAFRAGQLGAPFPDWSFRPSTPLLT